MYSAPFYKPFTALAWLARRTSRVELGTTIVILPYRRPLLLARMANNLDQLSNGRLVLGVRVGWAEAEFAALGVPLSQRGRLSDEYLMILQTCWSHEVAFVPLDWLARDGLPTLWRMAGECQRPTPAFAPRIRVRVTDA